VLRDVDTLTEKVSIACAIMEHVGFRCLNKIFRCPFWFFSYSYR